MYTSRGTTQKTALERARPGAGESRHQSSQPAGSAEKSLFWASGPALGLSAATVGNVAQPPAVLQSKAVAHTGSQQPIQRAKSRPGDEIDYTNAEIKHGIRKLVTAQSGRYTRNGGTLSVTASPAPRLSKAKMPVVGSSYTIFCSGATYGGTVTYQGTIAQIDKHPTGEYIRFYFNSVTAG